MRRWGLGLALLGATLPAWVRAQDASEGVRRSDYRPVDRFFFAFSGGAAFGSAGRIELSAPGNSASETSVQDVRPAVGFETTYWPNDFVGMGASVEYFTGPSPAGEHHTTTMDLGLMLVLALPLRYVQPYAGGWAGIRNTWLDSWSSRPHPELHPLVGVNVYLSRDVRFFAQWQYVRLDFTRVEPDVSVSFADAHTHLVMAGFRWSPSFFHEWNTGMKLEFLWWAAIVTVGGWALANAIAWQR